MAIGTRGNSNTTYLQVDYGKKSLYIYSKDPKEGYEKHTSSKGNVSYRMYVSYVSGYITGAYFREGTFGKEFVLVFQDEDERYIVPALVEDSFFPTLVKDLNMIDLDEMVQLSVYGNKSKANGKEYLNVSYKYPELEGDDGKPLKVAWGKDYPKGKYDKRRDKWDFTAMEDDAYDRALDFIKESGFEEDNEKFNSEKEEKTEVGSEKDSSPKSAEDLDDLPF